MAITAIRTVIIYVVLITAMRIMGKRQLGELQPIELVVTLLVADLAAVPMQNNGLPLLSGIIPIVVLVSMELLLSALMLKWNWFSNLVSGNPIVIINNGKLDQKALKKMRMTLDDLTETLRTQDVFDMNDVEYAIAETNGKISVFPKSNKRPPVAEEMGLALPSPGMPVLIVSDGKYCDWALEICGFSHEWVEQKLKEKNIALNTVFMMTSDRSGNYFILKRDH